MVRSIKSMNRLNELRAPRSCEFHWNGSVYPGIGYKIDWPASIKDPHYPGRRVGPVVVILPVWLLPSNFPDKGIETQIAISFAIAEIHKTFAWIEPQDTTFGQRLREMVDSNIIQDKQYLKWQVNRAGLEHMLRNFTEPMAFDFQINIRPKAENNFYDQPGAFLLWDIEIEFKPDAEYPIRLQDFAMTNDWQMVKVG